MAQLVGKQHLDTFDAIYDHLTTTYTFPVLAPPSQNPHDPSLSHAIASLQIHPALEAILHILNADLPSAHFLCRHMQNAPAWEGMYIHGLLHRVEGDIENARAWYGDVSESECFRYVWEDGIEGAGNFLDRVKKCKPNVGKDEVEAGLREESRGEIERLVEWCKKEFGMNKVEDATEVWVQPGEKHREMAAKMVVGGEGWRQF